MSNRQTLEVIGLISVIISLIFVGYEIRQNTNVARNQAYNDYSYRAQELLTEIATDEYLPKLITRVSNGELPEDFTDEERLRIIQIQNAAVRSWEGMYRSVQSGLLPIDILRGAGSGTILDNDFFRAIWPDNKFIYTEDFVSFFEEQDWNK